MSEEIQNVEKLMSDTVLNDPATINGINSTLSDYNATRARGINV